MQVAINLTHFNLEFMKLSDLGEFGFIQNLMNRFQDNLPPGVEGIGDDCAILPCCGDSVSLVTTDLFIEGVHFLKDKISPEDLGYKSLAVNLSDVAAMGGVPLYAFLSLGVPPNTEMDWMNRLLNSFQNLAKKEKVYLLGGDTSCSESIVINLLIIGEAKKTRIKRRSQAKLGDIICSSGHLGNAGAGLRVILNDLPLNDITKPLLRDHVHPPLYLKESQWLAQQTAVHAMIDISDGVDSDIRRIMESSECGAQIHVNQLPISSQLKQASQEFGWNPYEIALTGGEDYCLLLTVDPASFDAISTQYLQLFHHPLYPIGSISREPILVYLEDGEPISFTQQGFDHFQNKSIAF